MDRSILCRVVDSVRRHPVIVATKLGVFTAEFSRRGLARLEFPKSGNAQRRSSDNTGKLDRQLRDYAAGKPVRFGCRLDLSAGTPFQQAVWRAMLKIPRGEVRSYGWIARKIGRPRATRAVGAACGANPIPVIVPCHRVVASDGSIGGFGGGLGMKRKVLRLEGVTL